MASSLQTISLLGLYCKAQPTMYQPLSFWVNRFLLLKLTQCPPQSSDFFSLSVSVFILSYPTTLSHTRFLHLITEHSYFYSESGLFSTILFSIVWHQTIQEVWCQFSPDLRFGRLSPCFITSDQTMGWPLFQTRRTPCTEHSGTVSQSKLKLIK